MWLIIYGWIKSYVTPIIVIGGIITGAYLRGQWDESKFKSQEASLRAECEQAKAKNKEANDELQKNLSTVRSNLASFKRLHPGVCIRTDQRAAGRGEYAGKNGISTDWLRDYAAECEIYRQEVISLIK